MLQPPEIIAVGSQNPVKVDSAFNGLALMFPDRRFSASGFSVASGVSDQPMSNDETLRGARNRVAAIKAIAPEAAFWIGIEGGIEIADDQWFASAWIVICESSSGREAIGKSAIFALPPVIGKLIESGVELGVANDQVFGQQNSKHAGGAIGSLTGGVLGRAELYEHAMLAALAPFKNPGLYY